MPEKEKMKRAPQESKNRKSPPIQAGEKLDPPSGSKRPVKFQEYARGNGSKAASKGQPAGRARAAAKTRHSPQARTTAKAPGKVSDGSKHIFPEHFKR